ncbi:MAG: hypothetical protein FJY88_06610, partial [Candidatus Eisenbacteria bacterium]|nr:hypothetical protein [Candidatus Eisenbacteria bacterium]
MASCRRQLVILLGILAFCIATAHAFAPVEERADLAITRPGAERPPVWRQEGLRAEQHPEAALFEARAGSGWTYSWNAVNGTPHAVYGPGVDLSTGFLSGEAQAEDAARRFVDQHRDLLKVDPAQMKLVSVVNGLGKWGVIFQQEHDGIPVEDSFLRLLMTESGRLYYFGSDWHPAIGIATRPLLTVAEAGQFASRDVGFVAGRDLDEGGELLILPVPEGEGMGYRLVWRVRHRVEEPFAIWVSHVDAATGEVVWRYDDVCYANVVGTTAGDVEDYGYCYGEQDRRLPNMRVAVTGGNSGYSDLQGNYEITHSGTAPVTVTAQLDGRWINVNDQLDGDGTFTGTATPGVAFEIRWTDGWENDAARAIYLHGNRIHDAAKQYDPSWTSPDYRMSATANIASTCNAYWDGSTINFYRAGGGCGNTGQMGDVIYHEYAHGMTQWIYGNNPSDVGEGNSDTAALLLDRNSICGEGFYLDQCASGIRNAENTLIYPDDYQSGQIHFNGQFVSGFYWDSRQELVLIYGEEGVTDVLWPIWHFARRLIQPLSMPDQILAAFVTDDDDGNLNNGTPHYDAFCVGAT